MDRYFRRFVLVFIFCLWASQAYAAKTTATEAAPLKPPSSGPTEESPILNIPDAVYDFGEIMEGEPVVHSFAVMNPGKSPLEIQQVRPG